MNLNIISRTVQTFPTQINWRFEISLADYNTFIDSSPVDITLQSESDTYVVNPTLNNTGWAAFQIGGLNYLTISFYDLTDLPQFGINDVVTLSYTPAFSQSVTNQPGETSGLKIMAAYRPIVFDVEYVNSPPVTYCDIYFNDLYYKTLSKTNAEYSNVYRFDISDAAQEYLKSEIAPINGTDLNVPESHFVECFCKFRTSSYDTNGFIDQQGAIPVQGTSTSEPVSGGGVQSLSFYVLNAVLQHENNQNLKAHLDSFKKGVWDENTLPLTHRPKNYKVCANDSDYFPIVTCDTPSQLCVKIKYKDGTSEEVCADVTFNGYSDNNPIGCLII